MKDNIITELIALESILVNTIAEQMGITQDKYSNLIFNGEILEWEESVAIAFKGAGAITLETKDCETISCDYILFYGDGTIEFHDEESCDAYNWAEFDKESIKKVIEYLT